MTDQPDQPATFAGTITAVIRIDGHHDTARRLDGGLRGYLGTWASNAQIDHIRVSTRPATTRRDKARIAAAIVGPLLALYAVLLGVAVAYDGHTGIGAAVSAAGGIVLVGATAWGVSELRRLVRAEREDTLR